MIGRSQVGGDERVQERHLSLTARDDGVVVEPLSGATGTTLNDVQLTSQAVAHAGDELGVGRARLVVMQQSDDVPTRPRLASNDELMSRLHDEVRRAGTARSTGLLLVAMPPLNTPARLAMLRRLVEGVAKHHPVATWGELSGDVLLAVVPEASEAALEAVREALPAIAGQRARVSSAVGPRDGLEADQLLDVALQRLGPAGEVETVVADAMMVRLYDAADRLARKPAPVVWLQGPAGSGRATLARVMFPSMADAGTAGAKHWLWREAERLDAEGFAALMRSAAEARATLVVTSREGPMVPSAQVLLVPALVDRPSDIVPLAEAFLSVERRRLGRPRLSLGADARGLLGRYRWPGNVGELRNVIAFAARAAVRDEIGRDALPVRVTQEAPADSFRSALASTERDLLLEALSRTRWNVTAAATRLGMPRRTVVYRMRKLGLKRPAR